MFWGAVGFASVLGVSHLADALAPNDKPCPIVLGSNFTWENDGQMFVDVSKCDAPTNVTLHQNVTWEWTE